ncbi:hypothetical protein WR25_06800 [Diploscapter pachys]|uniref:Uncharacterized protein n=1 Tax=Diploscapter pachys TaxID=2018661 RepID=A0A2A2K6W9_9BILA|nr:hypothetical protein WR25_06800 [Diploscapter pachys]
MLRPFTPGYWGGVKMGGQATATTSSGQAELLAQLADEDVDDLEFGFVHAAIQVVQKHFLGQRGALAQAEQLEHRIFLAGQMHARAIDLDRLGVEIDGELAGADDRLRMALRTTDDRVDAGDQFFAMEGLGDVIVGAEAEAAHLAVHLVDAAQDQNRRGHAGDAQLLQHVIAVHVRQVQVEQDDVVVVQLAEVQALLAKCGRQSLRFALVRLGIGVRIVRRQVGAEQRLVAAARDILAQHLAQIQAAHQREDHDQQRRREEQPEDTEDHADTDDREDGDRRRDRDDARLDVGGDEIGLNQTHDRIGGERADQRAIALRRGEAQRRDHRSAQPQPQRRADVEQRILDRRALRGRDQEQEAALVDAGIGGEKGRADEQQDAVENEFARALHQPADVLRRLRPGIGLLHRIDDLGADRALRGPGGELVEQVGQLRDEHVDLLAELHPEQPDEERDDAIGGRHAEAEGGPVRHAQVIAVEVGERVNGDRAQHRPEGEDQQIARAQQRRGDRRDDEDVKDAPDEARIVGIGGETVHAGRGVLDMGYPDRIGGQWTRGGGSTAVGPDRFRLQGSGADPSPMKILLVDDDPVLADSLADELTGFGHALSTASDGRAALAAIDQDAFDAVVLDRMMPRLELKLLAELVRNADTVLTRAMLIERVWGYDFEPDTNLVDVYIRRLRQKLTAHGGDDPIQTMRGVGYLLRS